MRIITLILALTICLQAGAQTTQAAPAQASAYTGQTNAQDSSHGGKTTDSSDNASTSSQHNLPAVPDISVNADAWVLMDYQTGTIIRSHNKHGRHQPASLVKVMTAYLVAQALKDGNISLNDKVPVSHTAWQTGGSRMFIKPEDQPSVAQLLQGMIIASGNDASVALAEFVAGSEESFAAMMNQTARNLGMAQTHFTNSHGLPRPEQQTSAYDMAVLARTFIQNYPQRYKIYAEGSFSWNGITQANRNELLKINAYVDGLKTGHTRKAGFNLIASARKDGRRLIAVVLGAPSSQQRFEAANKLLTYGNRFYTNRIVLKANQQIAEISVSGANNPGQTVTLNTPPHDVILTVPKAYVPYLKQTVYMPDNIEAPVNNEQKIGMITIKADDKNLYSSPLYSGGKVKQAGFFQRTANSIKSLF